MRPIPVNRNLTTSGSVVTARQGMTYRPLFPFFAGTFGLSWGVIALGMLFTTQVEALFGPIGPKNPLFFLAVYAPAITGIVLVWWHYGLAGLASYFRRLTLWRMPLVWWAFLVFGIPALIYIGAAITGTLNDPFPFSPWYNVLPAIVTAMLLGPIEEFGWRGVALPLLQRRFAPLWAGVIVGVVWALWHVPSFFLSGTPQSNWALAPFLVGVVAIAVILTPMFNAARGSLLLAGLFHFQMMNPAWPDAQPWDTLVLTIAAIIIVLLNRRAMLTRDEAVTRVLMPEDADRTDHAHTG